MRCNPNRLKITTCDSTFILSSVCGVNKVPTKAYKLFVLQVKLNISLNGRYSDVVGHVIRFR